MGLVGTRRPEAYRGDEGYALQALFYYFLGEAFCENPDCRLYNAHYQSELIRSQNHP
jgi:hypothetical protein